MHIVKSLCTHTLSTLYILVKLVKCLFLFSLPDFILVTKDFQMYDWESKYIPASGDVSNDRGSETLADSVTEYWSF